MTEEQINELLQILFNAKYRSDSFDFEIIQKRHRDKIEVLVRKFLLDARDNELATLEAKVFAYEEIIKKSNFKPFAEDESKTVEP